MKVERETFGDLWESYARRVLPRTAGQVQRTETRRAFYAGGIALLSAVLSGLGEGEPTDDDVRALDAIRAEFEAFSRDLESGRA